jgi:DNA helicase HerA-like ATPase
MTRGQEIFVGAGETPQSLALKFSNRHGLIAGATGTGKTVTLQILAEGFSNAGVPVFLSDVKGDLSGLSQAGVAKPKLLARAEQIGMQGFAPSPSPVVFWDLFGKKGHPVRTTISDMGPLLLARLLEPQRDPGGRPEYRLPGCRRRRPHDSRSQGPEVAASVRVRQQ